MRRTSGIGAMRDRITLEKPTQTTDDIGGQTVQWTAEKTIFAYVNKGNMKGGRSMGSGRIEYDDRVEITFQLFDAPTIKSEWRVVYGSEVFIIETMVKDDIDNMVYLVCSRIQNALSSNES